MKKAGDIIEKALTLIIAFITATLFPSVVSAILGTNKNIALWTGLLSVFILISVFCIRHAISAQRASKNNRSHLEKNYHEMRLYAISSKYWCDLFSQQDIHVDNCTVLIREYIDGLCNKETYQAEVASAIHDWKELLKSGRINRLSIFTYKHTPDDYFIVFDTKLAYVGINNYDKHDSTGQKGYRLSMELYSEESMKTHQLIKQYAEHFDNYIDAGICQKIYDSMNL